MPDNVLGELGVRDGASHRALVLRTLGIDNEAYEATLRAFSQGQCAVNSARGSEPEDAIERLAQAFAPNDPHAATLGPSAPTSCAFCGGIVRVILARKVAGGGPPLVYGRCEGCGHGTLLAGRADEDTYRRGYHRRRGDGGEGYDHYGAEARYREAKAASLLSRLGVDGTKHGETLLEVGSGFGYTRAVAERLGVATSGVDVAPDAAEEASLRYGQRTFVGTLAEGLAAGEIRESAFAHVLYQFVLEHIDDPIAELSLARRSLAAGGRIHLVVPNMDAAERRAFGAAYRSLRADHLHLFTRASLEHVARAAGLRLVGCTSHCNLHLLVDFVSPADLAALYARGEGPDWIATLSAEPA